MNKDSENLRERDESLRLLINKGSEIAGGAAGPAVGTVIGSLLAGPAGAAVGGAVGAAATMAVKAIGHELSSRMLSPREQARVGGVFTLATSEIVERCRNGESVRSDGFFDSEDGGRSDAELPVRHGLGCFRHLLANLAFNPEISAAMAHQLTKAAESMTYRQLCILQLSATKERFNLRQQSYEREERWPKDLYQIIYEYYDLYNKGLINLGSYLASFPAEINPGTATPQALGVDIYNQMQLYLIPDGDLELIAAHLR